jgi:hypothetical protein
MVTTTQFISAVKRAITVPTYQPRFTDQDFLDLASEEQRTLIVPQIISVSQSYFLKKQEVIVPPKTNTIQFPVRAVGRKIKEVWYKTTNESLRRLYLVELSDAVQFELQAPGEPQNLVLEGDRVRIYPPNDLQGTIVWFYFLKPSNLCKVSLTGQITQVGVDYVALDSVPSNFQIGSLVDITQFSPGFEIRQMDLQISNISGNQVFFSGFSALNPLTNISTIDVVSIAGETSVIQLPEEGYDCLVQATALRVLKALNFSDQEKSINELLMQKMREMLSVFTPRIENQTQSLKGNIIGKFGARRPQLGSNIL